MLTLRPLKILAWKCFIYISYPNKNKKVIIVLEKNTFTIPLMPNLLKKKKSLDLGIWLCDLGSGAYGWCFLVSVAVWAACAVLFCMDEVSVRCICYLASSSLQMPLPDFFCFSFFHCSLYKSSLCGHVPTFSVHVFCGFNLGSYFWKQSFVFIYLFVSKCSRLLESSAHNRMSKAMRWLRFCYCQMFHLVLSLWSLC